MVALPRNATQDAWLGMPWWLVGGLCLLAFVALATARPVDAHAGDGGGAFVWGALEGEAYDTPTTAGGCDPTGDSEHTRAQAAASSSGGRQAFIPQSGCSIHYASVNFPADGAFTSFRAYIGGSTSTRTSMVTVFVDGVNRGQASFTQSGPPSYVDVPFTSTSMVASGLHQIRILHTMTLGAPWHNLHLDCVLFNAAPGDSCINPVPPPVADFTWVFTTTAPLDYDLDPVQFTDLTDFPDLPASAKEWDWDFGDLDWGSAQHPVHTYLDDGVYPVCLTAAQTYFNVTRTSSVCKDVTVNNRPPEPRVSARPIPRSLQGDVMSPVAIDLDGTIQEWWWDFGDGTSGAYGNLVRHTFPRPGTYLVCLRAMDDDGATGESCATITLHAEGPVEDVDHDGIQDASDNCPTVPNHDQADVDRDGTGDACSEAAGHAGQEAEPDAPPAAMPLDSDLDGVADDADNCPAAPNPLQADMDRDGAGDACDVDADGDMAPESGPKGAYLDNCPKVPNPDQADADGDDAGDACDGGLTGASGQRAPRSLPVASDAPRKDGAWTVAAWIGAAAVLGSLLAVVLVVAGKRMGKRDEAPPK